MKIRKTLALAMLALGVVGVSSCGTTEENNGGGTQQTDDLATAKANAISELESYATTKLNAVTDATQKTSATQKYNNGKATLIAAINSATTQDAINTALAAGKTAIDGYVSSSAPSTPTDDLATAKQTAITEFRTYAGTVINAISDATLKASATEKYTNNKATLEKAINDATTKAEIDAALAAGKAAIDSYATTVDGVQEIKTADDFIAMLEKLEGDYKLINDIDLSDKAIPAAIDGGFKGTIDGNGKTVTLGTAARTVSKTSGLFYKRLEGATIKNITISGGKISAGGDVVSLFGGILGATFENIKIDGINFTCAKYSGLLGSKCAGEIVVKNVAVINSTIAAGDYSGVLFGDLTNGVSVLGSTELTASANATIQNILIDANLTGPTQGSGFVAGLIDNKATDLVLSVDGAVINGRLEAANGATSKAAGAIVGNSKAEGGTTALIVKNVLTLDFQAKVYVALDPVDTTKVGIAYGDCKAATKTVENVKIVNGFTKIFVADTQISNSTYTEAVEVNQIVAPTEAFTIADGKISLGTLGSVTLPVKADEGAVSMGTIADANAADAAVGTANGSEITFTGTIGYYHKASNLVDNAGNAVELKITAAADVSTTGATIAINDESAQNYTSGSTIYLPVTDLTSTTTLTVKWNDAATPQTYTVKFNNATLENAPVYGDISNASTDLTATAEGDTITYTSGTIAWDATNRKNSVLVKVAKPTWVTDASGVKVTGGTIQGTVAADATEITVLVGVKEAGASFKVQWTSTTDAKTYNIAVNGATIEENPNAAYTKTADSDTVLTILNGSTSDKALTASENVLMGDYFTLSGEGSKIKTNGQIEVAKSSKNGKLSFTTTGAATVTVTWFSTGGTNASTMALYKADGTMVGEVHGMIGQTPETIEYTLTEAGTYYFASPGTALSTGETTSGRGFRISFVEVILAH